MTSPSNAPNEKKVRISFFYIIIFVALSLAASWYLFPKKILVSKLLNGEQVNQVSLIYLRNLATVRPNDLDLHLALAEHELKIGNFTEADKAIKNFITLEPKTNKEWRMLMIHYQITKNQTYAYQEDSSQRLQGLDKMKQLISAFSHAKNLNEAELKELSKDAISLNNPSLAIEFYHEIIAIAPNQPVDFFVNAGKVALYATSYQQSANFYKSAMIKSLTINNKRNYFILAIKSLIAGGQSDSVIQFANKNIDGLANDPQTLLFLAKYAQSSNNGSAAQNYIKRALNFNYIGNNKKNH